MRTYILILAAEIPRELGPGFRFPLPSGAVFFALPQQKGGARLHSHEREQSADGAGVETVPIKHGAGHP
jgi:hypothetical protein